MNGIKKGIWPTMITPYDREGRVDLNAAKRIVDWYARRNCDGIFAVCQSSEMFNLSLEERVALARTVVEAAQGRLEVIASGHISDDPQAQVEELGAIAETGVKAVVQPAGPGGRGRRSVDPQRPTDPGRTARRDLRRI